MSDSEYYVKYDRLLAKLRQHAPHISKVYWCLPACWSKYREAQLVAMRQSYREVKSWSR